MRGAIVANARKRTRDAGSTLYCNLLPPNCHASARAHYGRSSLPKFAFAVLKAGQRWDRDTLAPVASTDHFSLSAAIFRYLG
jgi:hypothetical protein